MNDFFEKQHFVLKLLILLLSILILIPANIYDSLFLFTILILFFIPNPNLYTLWLKTCLKLIPFFIAYFLLGTVFNIDFELQLLTSAKIIIFLLLSVYIISTTSLENFLADISFLCKQNSEFTIYLAAIFEFIPLFIKNFKKIRSNPIHAAVNAISKTADESVGIHQNIKKKLEKTLPKRELANIPNMFLLILILLMILRMGKVI